MTPRLIKGDILIIGDEPYLVKVGCPKDKLNDPYADYNVHLQSINYNPNKFVSDYYCKVSKLPAFVKTD